MKAELI